MRDRKVRRRKGPAGLRSFAGGTARTIATLLPFQLNYGATESCRRPFFLDGTGIEKAGILNAGVSRR